MGGGSVSDTPDSIEYVRADKVRAALNGHRCSELFGESGLLAATMRDLDVTIAERDATIAERDEAIRSCHIWQKGYAELVAERDYLISLLEGQQFFADTKSTKPERKHIGRWGHNKEEFTSPYINQSNED